MPLRSGQNCDWHDTLKKTHSAETAGIINLNSIIIFGRMAGNTFGEIFRLTTFGESHGPAIGGVIDGCPPGLAVDFEKIQHAMDRRRPGQSAITTQRAESDVVQWLSGIFEGRTTGAPIGFLIANKDQKSKDYDALKDVYRPSHADFTYEAKYGIRDHRGGGRSSARETACRVAAGALAAQILEMVGVSFDAFVDSVGDTALEHPYEFAFSAREENELRCPDSKTAAAMRRTIETIREQGDSIGGTITCVIRGAPVGLGEPVFDKFHADLGKAMLSINAVKGFEIGSGFAATRMRGSEHNDPFEKVDGEIRTRTNHGGGVLGGITNGMDIAFRVAFKPVASIAKVQDTVDREGQKTTLGIKGRHDPCVVPRAVPIVEAMAALVVVDHYLRNKTSKPI